jgi:hypothetical protein
MSTRTTSRSDGESRSQMWRRLCPPTPSRGVHWVGPFVRCRPKTTDFGAPLLTGTIHRNLSKPKPAADRYRYGQTLSSIIGYARVSTREQSPEAQEAELTAYGVARVFTDRGESIRVADRPGWLARLDYLCAGDTVVIRRLDRIAAGDRDLLHSAGTTCRSLSYVNFGGFVRKLVTIVTVRG